MFFLRPGSIYFGDNSSNVGTVLGSCVALVIWHRELKILGMSHFVLPYVPDQDQKEVREYKKPEGFYGDEAIKLLNSKAQSIGTTLKDYETKVFGGSNALELPEMAGLPSIGERNIEAAFEFVEQYDMNLISSDVGGEGSRRITCNPQTGSVWVRYLKSY